MLMQNKFQKMFSSQAGIIFCRLALFYCGAAGVANYYFSGSSLSAAKLLNGCCLRLCLFGAAKVRFIAAPRFLCWKSFF